MFKAYHSAKFATAEYAANADSLYVVPATRFNELIAEIELHEDLTDYVFYDLTPCR